MNLQNCWNDFWFEYHPPRHIVYGPGGPKGHTIFRWQRLFNVIVLLLIVVVIIFLILK